MIIWVRFFGHVGATSDMDLAGRSSKRTDDGGELDTVASE